MSKYTMHATRHNVFTYKWFLNKYRIKPRFNNESASEAKTIHKREVLMVYPVSLHILGKKSLHQILWSVFTYNREEGRCKLLAGIRHPQRCLMVACSKQWLWSCTQIWKPFTTKASKYDTISVNRSQTPATCSHNH